MYSPKISVIIPHMSLPGADEALEKCVNSLKSTGEAMELKIIINEGGYAKAVNKGLSESSGDYLFVINNDTTIITGKLSDMFMYNISVPVIIPTPRDNLPRCFFGMPRDIYESIRGYIAEDFFDEIFFPGYFEDDDLHKRIARLGWDIQLVDKVLVHHKDGGGLTIKQLGEQESYDINKKRYEDKWINIV